MKISKVAISKLVAIKLYTRYSRVADEKQKKRSKAHISEILKLILDIIKLQIKKRLRGRLRHFKNSKGDGLKKTLGNPDIVAVRV